MKVSRYNHRIAHDGRLLLFNAYRRGLHDVGESVYSALDQLEAGAENWDSELSDSTRATLVEAGYVIEDDVDEHTTLLAERESLRLSTEVIGLTIAPTIDCNFGCPYCFEGAEKPQERMSEQTMSAVVNFARGLITESTRGLSITWFGGEPLLGMSQIEQLTHRFRSAIVEPMGLHYAASIVTNGYGLTRKIATRLRDLGVVRTQITLDGTAEYHNQRRFRIGGHPTFDRIVENIVESCDVLRISVRVNVDEENRESFVPLVKYLQDELGLKGKVSVYPAMLRQ